MHRSKHKDIRRVEGDRLVYYKEIANASFWEKHWQENFSPDIYRHAEQGSLGFLEKTFIRWLPKQGRILEAGCGLGHLVLALRARGYDVEGVEWSKPTVELVRRWRPDLPIRVGNVMHLEVPDGHYAGYISLGVVEHRREGPEPFLAEASRILEPGGIALISVPWFNPLRRFKARLGWYWGNKKELDFYQYAFTEQEFIQIIKNCGFEILDVTSYDPVKGLKDEIFLLRYLLKQHFIGWRLNYLLSSFFNRSSRIAQLVSHMLLIVAQKPTNECLILEETAV